MQVYAGNLNFRCPLFLYKYYDAMALKATLGTRRSILFVHLTILDFKRVHFVHLFYFVPHIRKPRVLSFESWSKLSVFLKEQVPFLKDRSLQRTGSLSKKDDSNDSPFLLCQFMRSNNHTKASTVNTELRSASASAIYPAIAFSWTQRMYKKD